ncbi:unnamed protein product [Litomosoides sigmodontis]|uniref:Olfactomedin-like domain-containing protein n=1 Tax=Litomosoides sigmodontis TaxID=42156 RepID=A0A3P6SIQ8_LITSI|nr:unnamed protein product [Litomosoides sigmodontis]
MWLYSATIFIILACLLCASDSLNTKRRLKQKFILTPILFIENYYKNGNHVPATSHRRRYRISATDKGEAQVPMKIPKLSRAQKVALIIASGQNPFEKRRKRKEKGRKRSRKTRNVKRYVSNAYLLLDDSAGGELRWKMIGREVEHGEESNGLQNLRLEANVETTTAPVKTELASLYGNGYYWSVSTSSYWRDTIAQGTTATHRENSPSIFRQTTIDHAFWKQNPNATSSTFTTTASSSVREAMWDGSEEAIRRKLYTTTPAQSPKLRQPLALPMNTCPHRFDAVTRAFNGRTYVFARDRVYQLWRHDNLHQKASFLVNEMFPKGPRTVTVAYTNSRSGITVLIEHQTVYRYRWNRKNKVFYLARKSPQQLTKKMPVYPRAGFQWIDGNQVLVEGENFATYDAYWNVATFAGLTTNYFPQFPRDLIGLTYQNDTLFILYTASNKIQIYDTRKYRVLQEYPIQIDEFIGCYDG